MVGDVEIGAKDNRAAVVKTEIGESSNWALERSLMI